MLAMMDGMWTPTFQSPDPQMVMLGASGESISVQKAEDGTYWVGADLLSDGDTRMSSDGRSYTLSLANGMWMANFAAPMTNVPLGTSGESATLVQAEDGTYWLGDALVVSGETMATTMDGYNYTLSMDEDGMWMATYMPVTQQVAVGNTGISVTAVRDESGAWSFTNPLDGSNVPLVDGMEYPVGEATYRASYADGVWTATYVAREVMVALGTSGEMVTLVVAEDGTYWLGADLVVSGTTTARSTLGVMYTLSLGEDGMWTAMPMGNEVSVMLGISGMATLVLAEDGTWWNGSDQVADGSMIAAANGNMYRINMDEDGMWMATYVPAEMMVMGTTLVAMANEDGVGYTIDGASLPASGNGNITTSDGGMYRIHMADDMLHGARYDVAIKTDSDGHIGLSGFPTLVGDTFGTAANEAATMLTVNDENFSIGELLGGGMSGLSGDNIVADALAEITKLANRAKAYEALNVQLGDSTQDVNILAIWNGDDLQAQINRIFGTADNTQAGTDNLDLTPTDATSADTVLEDFDKLITALSSADAFVAATAEDGDGILEAAGLSAENAMKYFDANASESMTFYRTTENTRYGAYYRTVRRSVADDATALVSANQDLNFMDATAADSDIGDHGVFSWGVNIPDTVNRSYLPPSGTLHYTGGTLAVATGDAFDSPMLYEGTIDIQLSLTRNTISGIVSDLMDMDGGALVMNFAEVSHIVLPSVSPIPATLIWTGGDTLATGGSNAAATTNPAHVFYRVVPGVSRASAEMQGAWHGSVLGNGDDLATAVVGHWWIAAADANDQNTLTGSYGAERVDRPEPPSVPLPALADAETTVFDGIGDGARNASITDAGELKITMDPAGTADNDDDDVSYTIAISSLTQGSQKTINGATHISELQDYVAAQRKILAGWVALDATTDGNEAETNAGRNTVWQNIRNRVLDRFFNIQTGTTGDGATATRGFMDENYPGAWDTATSAASTTAADDVEGMAFLDRLEAALGSANGIDAARHAGGIFYNDDDDMNYQACNNATCTAPRDLEAGSAINGRRAERLIVGFDTTDYTRFGFWRREFTTHAARAGYDRTNSDDTDVTSRNNGFAYSALTPAAYASTADPVYPQGTATYTGKTIANQHTTRWMGDVNVIVVWDAATIGSSDVTVVISDLVNPDGIPVAHNGLPVRQLIFTGTDNVTASTDAATLNQLTFASTAGRVAHQDRSLGDVAITGDIDLVGSFVGKGLSGPQAVIGTWSIAASATGINNDANRPIVGGFGADLTGAP